MLLGIQAGAVCEELLPWGGLMQEKFMENWLLWEGPLHGAGDECKESSPEEEGAAETRCDELATTPFPSTCAIGRGER